MHALMARGAQLRSCGDFHEKRYLSKLVSCNTTRKLSEIYQAQKGQEIVDRDNPDMNMPQLIISL